MSDEMLAPPISLPANPDPDRLEKIVSWIVAGLSERQIGALIEKTWPGAGGAAGAAPLIVAAMRGILETGEADPVTVKGWCIEATRAIYRKSLAEGDLDLALRAVHQMFKMAGG